MSAPVHLRRVAVAMAMASLIMWICVSTALPGASKAPANWPRAARRESTPLASASTSIATWGQSPIGLRAAISSRLARAKRQFAVAMTPDRGLVARGGGLTTTFGRSGASVRARGARLSLRLSGISFGGRRWALRSPSRAASGDQVSYRRGSLTEWYRNASLGLEQGFTISRRPSYAAAGLTIAIRVSGGLTARRSGRGVVVSRRGRVLLRYGGMSALDAVHHRLPVQLGLAHGTLRLSVEDAHARYPLTIDPFIQQGAKLTAADSAVGDLFGLTIALSRDGNTALVGGFRNNDDAGAAWVFVRSGSTWTQQGPKLTADDEQGSGEFGSGVALSADGNTALIGGSQDDNGVGAAWVFVRSGSRWTQQGAKLLAADETGPPNSEFGDSVALSSDGSTALIGGGFDNLDAGAAWVFTRSGSTWTQQGPKLTADDEAGIAFFGGSVALSGDGNTALIGGRNDNPQPYVGAIGAAWVFTRSGATWSQQGPKLVGSGATQPAWQGTSVALSADGDTALLGGPGDDNNLGAVWTFLRSGSNWTQLGPKLTAGSDETGGGQFGSGVAVSADGATSVVGAPYDDHEVGAAWVFARTSEGWSQRGRLTATDERGDADFGASVALSSDGGTALVGGYKDNNFAGAAWAFGQPVSNPPPTLTVTLSGTGSGTVTGSGISCSSTCTNSYPSGTTVTLTATPASGSTFTGWSGGGCSGTGTCQLTLTSDTSVTATFNATGPPTTALRCLGPASADNVFIQGIEVTQGVQTITFPDTAEGCYSSPLDSRSHPGALYPSGRWRDPAPWPPRTDIARYVKLVQGRRMVVRVFAASYAGSSTAPVDLRLFAFRNGRPLARAPLEPMAGLRALSLGLPFDIPYYTERIKADGAYEFELPGSSAHGNLTLVAELNPTSAPPELAECAGCGVDDVFTLSQITFTKTPAVAIHPAELNSTGRPVTGFPSPPAIFSKERLVLPVADGQPSVPSQYDGFLNLSLLTGEAAPPQHMSKELWAVMLWCCFNGLPSLGANPIDDYVGVDPSFAGQTPDGTPVSAVNPARPLTSVAHEIGHGFGLHHAGTNCPNQFSPFIPPPTDDGQSWPIDDKGFLQGVGLDQGRITPDGYHPLIVSSNPLGERAPLNDQVYDLMSYCVGYLGTNTDLWEAGSWISPINWNRLVEALASGSAVASPASLRVPARDAPAARMATARDRTLRVFGTMTQTGATINYVEPSHAPAASGPSSSPYHLIARDRSGHVLEDVGMQVHEGHAYMGPSFTLLSATVRAGRAKSIEITRASQVVAQRVRSGHPPRVRILAPRRGATVGRCWWRGRRCSVPVRWRTRGRRGRALAFVDYSFDHGRRWHTIYLGPNRGSAALPATLFSHARSARVRVRVNDGFNETSAISRAFTAAGQPPTVAITSPASGEHVASNASLLLTGSAWDDSGRAITGKKLRWYAEQERQRPGRARRHRVAGKRHRRYIWRKLVGTGREVITTRKLPRGTVRIRLVARDSQRRSASATVVVHVFISR
jgi:hypothetical protein